MMCVQENNAHALGTSDQCRQACVLMAGSAFVLEVHMGCRVAHAGFYYTCLFLACLLYWLMRGRNDLHMHNSSAHAGCEMEITDVP